MRVLWLGHEDPAEPGCFDVVGPVEELQQVHVFEVEGQAATRAVDLDPDGILAPVRETGGLEYAERSAPELRQEGGGRR